MTINFSQAVILAGGLGKRLHPLTKSIPKPLAPVNNVPFLDYIIQLLIDNNFKKILILVGYKKNLIIERYKNLKAIKVQFSFAETFHDTGSRLLRSQELLDDYFMLLYGDNYFPLQLLKLKSNFIKKNALVTTTVFNNVKGTGEYGWRNNIEVDKNGKVISYNKKLNNSSANGVDIGFFLVSKKALNFKIKDNISFENDILKNLIKKERLYAYCTNEQYYYVTNFESLKNFEKVAIKQNIEYLNIKDFNIG